MTLIDISFRTPDKTDVDSAEEAKNRLMSVLFSARAIQNTNTPATISLPPNCFLMFFLHLRLLQPSFPTVEESRRLMLICVQEVEAGGRHVRGSEHIEPARAQEAC